MFIEDYAKEVRIEKDFHFKFLNRKVFLKKDQTGDINWDKKSATFFNVEIEITTLSGSVEKTIRGALPISLDTLLRKDAQMTYLL